MSNESGVNLAKLKIALLLLRIGIFMVFFVWSLDKLLNSGRVKDFYPDMGLNTTYIIGLVQMVLALALLMGLYKTFSYGLTLVIQAISTLLPFFAYLHPFDAKVNLLYFAAWPMLAACITIYIFRQEDTLLTLNISTTNFRRK